MNKIQNMTITVSAKEIEDLITEKYSQLIPEDMTITSISVVEPWSIGLGQTDPEQATISLMNTQSLSKQIEQAVKQV